MARLTSEDLGGKDEDARNATQYMYTPCQDGQDHRRAAQSMPEDPYAGKDEDTRGSTMQFNRKTKAKTREGFFGAQRARVPSVDLETPGLHVSLSILYALQK